MLAGTCHPDLKLLHCIFFVKMVTGLINANPVIHEKKERRVRQAPETTDENAAEPIDQLEIFDILLHAFHIFMSSSLLFCYALPIWSCLS
jgi:hypothetical protein